ncbi:MAG TPA: 3-oxoacyl-ACP reductase [Bacillota bacterium]|nr:3-oxoacyl-ACP reductase [Bacillota bacterium]
MLKGKVVLVTGASRGIGAEIAKQLGKQGAIVIVNYLQNQCAANEVVKDIEQNGGTAVAIQADVIDSDQVEQMVHMIVDNFMGIDVVVNNALPHYTFNPRTRKPAWEIKWQDYQTQIQGNLGGAYNVTHAVLPYMTQQQEGRIINIVTNLIDFPIVPYHDYTTAKSALLGFSRNMAAELGAFGIKVNCVAPGLTAHTDSSQDTPENVRESIIGLTPLKRLTHPQDIAGAVLFLASSWSSFITGQCIYVDGGLTMK